MRNLINQKVVVSAGEAGYVCFDNQRGGTAIHKGTEAFPCTVVRQWNDYECGWRLVGTLTGKGRVLASLLDYKPDNIYFSEWNDIRTGRGKQIEL